MRVAGIMSGTSLDGIDVAIIDITGSGWNKKVGTVAFYSEPYPAAIRKALLAVSNTQTHTADIARLNFLLPELYAEAVQRCCEEHRISLDSLELVGCHGQTIFHEGSPVKLLGRSIASTLQIGDGSVLAERLKKPVVSDFRPRDMAAGGRGAPLVPFVDYLLFRDRRRGRVALNIGGIANLTAIPPAAAPEQIIAFDTGPGNMVMDALAAEHTRGRQQYDKDGRIAAQGTVDTALLRELMRDKYYSAPPPKTAGREQYGPAFLERLKRRKLPLPDLIATATALTAATIAEGIERFALPRMNADELIISGGGARNPRLLAYLAGFLPEVEIQTSEQYGIDADAKEAIAFAILAFESWHHRPGNLPSATGARQAVTLGKISY
jgi:anhydro-N-acetylmuramic acid kinase